MFVYLVRTFPSYFVSKFISLPYNFSPFFLGSTAILPWGICQTTCCKRKSKSKLREKFSDGIPIVSRYRLLKSYQPAYNRLEALERFINLSLASVADPAVIEPKSSGIEGGEGVGASNENNEEKKKNKLPKFRPLSFP